MRKLNFLPVVLLFVFLAITGCDIFSSDSELSQTEKILIGDPWKLSSYEVQNEPAGDGFSVAEEFHFIEDNKMKSLVNGNEHESKWTFKKDERLIILFQESPQEDGVIEMEIDKITDNELVLSFRNFGHDVIANFIRKSK